MDKIHAKRAVTVNMVVPVLIVLCVALSLAAPGIPGRDQHYEHAPADLHAGHRGLRRHLCHGDGNMDISTGSQIGLNGVIVAFFMMRLGIPWLPSIVLTLIAGLVLGFANGIFAACTSISPFIITLGTMQIYKGASYIISGGLPIAGLPETFKLLGQGYVSVVPVPVIVLVVAAIISAVVLTRTSVGRHIYAMGGNAEATRLAGVDTRKLITLVYSVNGPCLRPGGHCICGPREFRHSRRRGRLHL